MKPRLYLHVSGASHFLSWELPYFHKYFDIIDNPSPDVSLFAFGPDAFESAALLPAKYRIALLFPGFGYNPYHSMVHRYGMMRLIEDHYDLIFANPGPIAESFAQSPKLRLCSFSLDTSTIKVRNYRKEIKSLLHISANYPQKDWFRSREVMRLTGLSYEVYPPRVRNIYQKVCHRLKLHAAKHGWFSNMPLLQSGYESHAKVIAKYSQYDGFVHVAAETPPFVDGKYTAALLEAGLTGCILFWHDTLGLGNDFETIFALPSDPQLAADEILNIRQNINIEVHSRRTAEEIADRVNPDHIMKARFQEIQKFIS